MHDFFFRFACIWNFPVHFRWGSLSSAVDRRSYVAGGAFLREATSWSKNLKHFHWLLFLKYLHTLILWTRSNNFLQLSNRSIPLPIFLLTFPPLKFQLVLQAVHRLNQMSHSA